MRIKHSHNVPPFLKWCAHTIPAVFDDSLTYYEALCALWKWLQENLVDVVNNNATVTEQYIAFDEETRRLMTELQSYVDNYFDNLDVQDEVNTKLDAMVEDGTLDRIMAVYSTPELFGAKGDGVTDDTEAFQRYIDSLSIGRNVILNQHKAVYKLSGTIDFKGHGIIGNGISGLYDINNGGLKFVEGTYENSIAMKNVGREVKSLTIAGIDIPNIDCMQLSSAYDTTISDVSVNGFHDQMINDGISVAFRVYNFEGTGFNGASIHIKDSQSQQSTTSWFSRCMFYDATGIAIKYDKEVYNCSFSDIVFENINGGIQGSLFYSCYFNNIWAEGTKDGEEHDWLVNTTSQQVQNCFFHTLYVRSPWTNRNKAEDLAEANALGGVALHNNSVMASGSTGKSIVVDENGIHTRHNPWLGPTYRPLVITTQATASDSNYQTPIHIKAPNGQLYLYNQNNSHDAVNVKRLIGENADHAEVIGEDDYNLNSKHWKSVEPLTNTNVIYTAPLFITYDTNNQTPQNGGWQLTKESTGVFVLDRVSGNTRELSYPSIIVSGIMHGGGLGDTQPLLPAIQVIESYSGSYSAYSIMKGFKIIFKNLSNENTDPTRFTICLTKRTEK